MAINAQGVVPTEEGVKIFYSIVSEAYAETLKELQTADLSTKARRSALKTQIEGIVKNANDDVKAWLKVELPALYEGGMFEAVKGHQERDGQLNIDMSFGKFHKESVEAIASKAYQSIASGMEGLLLETEKRIADETRRATLDKIIKGRIKGDTRESIGKDVVKELRKEGISALTDRGGREWDLKVYADMLARTTLTEAHNKGMINQTAANGFDLVQVSSHYASCPLCAPWQGKVLSATGATKGFDTVKDAEYEGLFHPNCRHAIAPYHSRYLDESVAWDTEQQKYVPWKELEANDFNREQLAMTTRNTKELFDYKQSTLIGSRAYGSTIGMKKQWSMGVDFDKIKVLPDKLVKHAVDDYSRKIAMQYPHKDPETIVKSFAKKYAGKEFKTVEDLHKDLLVYTKALGIPADPLNSNVEKINKAFFVKGKISQIERSFIVNQDGLITAVNVGNKTRVGLPQDTWRKAKDSVLIHNHPNSSSFSMEDWLTAKKLDMKEIRAVGKDYTYVLERPEGGWKGNQESIKTAWNMAKEDVLPAYMKKLDAGQKMTSVEASEIVNKKAAEILGLKLTKIETIK